MGATKITRQMDRTGNSGVCFEQLTDTFTVMDPPVQVQSALVGLAQTGAQAAAGIAAVPGGAGGVP